jgi:hypothetical protein
VAMPVVGNSVLNMAQEKVIKYADELSSLSEAGTISKQDAEEKLTQYSNLFAKSTLELSADNGDWMSVSALLDKDIFKLLKEEGRLSPKTEEIMKKQMASNKYSQLMDPAIKAMYSRLRAGITEPDARDAVNRLFKSMTAKEESNNRALIEGLRDSSAKVSLALRGFGDVNSAKLTMQQKLNEYKASTSDPVEVQSQILADVTADIVKDTLEDNISKIPLRDLKKAPLGIISNFDSSL